MGLRKFRKIHRNIQADLSFVSETTNRISSELWNLSPTICFDDDLDLWKGFGKKKKMQKKKAKTGLLNWKIVDEHG